MRSRFDQWIIPSGRRLCDKNARGNPPRRIIRSIGLLSATALSPSVADAAPVLNGLATSQIVSFSAFIAILAFSVVSTLYFTRQRERLERERRLLASELADIRARADRFEALVHTDDQRFIIWTSARDKAMIVGNLPERCPAPADAEVFMKFAAWLEPDSAVALEQSIAALRARGAGFQIAIVARARGAHSSAYLDAYGHTVGGRVFVRFRDLSGDQQVIMELRRQLAERLSDVQNYQALLEEIPQPVWLQRKDENGKSPIFWANKAYCEAVANGKEAKSTIDELLDSDTRLAIAEAHGRAEAFKSQVHAVSKGARRRFDVVSVPTNNGSASIATDVSDAEKARAALSRTIKSHEMTFNELATAVAIFDKSHRLTFHNNAYRDLFGLDEAFLASGPSDSEVIDKLRSLEKLPIEANFREWKNKLLKVHQNVELSEDTWHLPDGQTLRVVASPRSTGGVTWIYENLTTQLNLESRVNVLSRLQAETLNRLSDGVAVFSSDGKLTLANESFIALWQLDRDILAAKLHVNKLAGQCIERFACIEDWHHLKMAVVSVSENRNEAAGIMERPDGSVIRYSTNALIDGRTMVTFVDITDSVNLERSLLEKNEALHEADRLKTDFVKHVNYELRSPLTNIIGFTQLLSDADIGPLTDKQQEYINYILSSSSSLLAIINDILDLATADAGVLELSFSEISIKETIENAIEGLQDRLHDRRIEVVQSIAPDVQSFIGDERRMTQILFNLLSNAIQFSDEGSRINVKVSRTNGNVIFDVQDWGAGIPEVFINHVFDRFESRSSGSARGGAGLGLSIVKRFVELHHGAVSIDSREGVGTTIRCTFPSNPQLPAIAAQ